MNTIAKRMISLMTVIGILSALLAGCGGEEVVEVVQTETQIIQEDSQEVPQEPMELPEMKIVEIGDEDAAALVQAGLDTVVEESELWSITEITDTEALMELMQGQGGGEHPEGETFVGEPPENMTLPDGEFGELPEMPEWDGENPPENMEGKFLEGGRQPDNRGGGMPGLAIVIANAEGTVVPMEDVLTAIEAAAETLGYSTMSMEITEEQTALLEIPDGYTGSRIVLINAQMPEMETWEPAG